MKKLSILAIVTFAVLSMTSCKKSYHCECTVFGITSKSASAKYSSGDAKDAQKACESTSVCKWVKE